MTMEDLIRRADVVRPMLCLYRYLRKREKDGEKAGKTIDKALNAAAAACVKECVTTAMEAPAVRVDTWIGTERQKPEPCTMVEIDTGIGKIQTGVVTEDGRWYVIFLHKEGPSFTIGAWKIKEPVRWRNLQREESDYAGETDERGDRGVRDPLPDGNGGSVRGPVGEIGGEPPGPPEGEGEAGA